MPHRIVTYPARFITDPTDGGYTILFPDVSEAISQADDMTQGLQRAQEVLGLVLYEEENLPVSQTFEEASMAFPNDIIQMITVNLDKTKKHVKIPMVRKNTRIPADLAEKAEAAGINFSATLRDALKAKLSQ